MEAKDEKRLLRYQKQMASYELLIVDELGFVPLSKSGAELLFEVFSQRYERGSTLVTSNLAVPGMDRGPRIGTADRSPTGPTHPPRPYPGNERRELPPEAEQTQTKLTAELLIRPPPASTLAAPAANTPRGGGRLPLRPKRAAFQAAQASAPDALLPDNPRSPTCSSGLLLLQKFYVIFRHVLCRATNNCSRCFSQKGESKSIFWLAGKFPI